MTSAGNLLCIAIPARGSRNGADCNTASLGIGALHGPPILTVTVNFRKLCLFRPCALKLQLIRLALILEYTEEISACYLCFTPEEP